MLKLKAQVEVEVEVDELGRKDGHVVYIGSDRHDFYDEHLQELIKEFAERYAYVQKMELNGTMITDNGVRLLRTICVPPYQLQHIVFNDNQNAKNALQWFGEIIVQPDSTLKILQLNLDRVDINQESWNLFCKGLESFCKALESSSCGLQSFDLRLRDHSIPLFRALRSNQSLKILKMEGWALSPEEMEELSLMLMCNKTLQTLSVKGCCFTSDANLDILCKGLVKSSLHICEIDAVKDQEIAKLMDVATCNPVLEVLSITVSARAQKAHLQLQAILQQNSKRKINAQKCLLALATNKFVSRSVYRKLLFYHNTCQLNHAGDPLTK